MEPEKQGFFAETKELIEQYINDHVLLVKLQAAEKIAKASSVAYFAAGAAFILFIIVMLATFLLGLFLSNIMGSYYAGFGIVIGIYILLLVALVIIHKKFLKNRIADSVIKSIFEK
ncbi:MAG: phage holin family protein [Segetibacter sp.]|nr:phage holin family protein [Segetibacter sp.]